MHPGTAAITVGTMHLSTSPAPCAPLAVLIVERNPVIAADIAATVGEVLGACAVTVAADVEAARKALPDPDGSARPAAALAIVGSAPEAIRTAGLDRALTVAGCAVVVVGEAHLAREIGTCWPGWVFVATPFTTAAMSQAICAASAPQRRPGAGTRPPVGS